MGQISDVLGPLVVTADKEVSDVGTQAGVVDTAKAAEAAKLTEYQTAQTETQAAKDGLSNETSEARSALQALLEATQAQIDLLP